MVTPTQAPSWSHSAALFPYSTPQVSASTSGISISRPPSQIGLCPKKGYTVSDKLGRRDDLRSARTCFDRRQIHVCTVSEVEVGE
jgi:hypothetical protein